MPLLDVLTSTALESIAFGLLLGIVLTVAVALAFKAFGPVNAATRALVWIITLAVLPLIPALYFVSHLRLPERPAAAAVESVSLLTPVAPPPAPSPSTTKSVSTAPAIAPQPLSVELPEGMTPGFFGLYVAVVFILLFRLFISYIRLRLLRRRTQPAPPELTARLEQWLVRCPTSRPVELRLSSRARSPLAIGFLRPVIVMPTDLVLHLNQQEYDDLGVHELAHIRRADDWTNLLQRLLQAFLFFHPAAVYIGRKLKLERELACDDWVVAAHEGKSYARCLAKVIELRRYHRGALLLSSGAFFGKRQIVKRVEALLDKTRNAATTVSSMTVIAILIAVAALASQIAHLPHVVTFIQDGGDNRSMHWSDNGRDLRIKIRGEVTFSPDEQSVSAISPAGFIVIDESKGWSHRRLEVRPATNGGTEEKYFLDEHEKPIDGVGRAWAAGIYLIALREMGIDSEARVSRLLARQGPSGVLEEVGQIHSDRVKVEYLTQLLGQAKLTTPDLQRVTDNVYKMSSDNDKADFLVTHQADLLTDAVRFSYFRAVNSIHSDNDRRRVLVHVLETDGHDAETARLVGQSAREMSSDNDKADVLLSVPAATSGNSGCALLMAAQKIQSDNDKARVLGDAAYVESSQCRDAYFAVVNLINSDNDRSEVLQNLLKHGPLGDDTYRNIANSAKSMNSDNDKANVLVLEGNCYNGAAFFDAVNSIQSSNDRARVLAALLQGTPSQPVLLEIIKSASLIPADHEKAEILVAVAKRSAAAEVRSALQEACQKLNSDDDYRRVASAIFAGMDKAGGA